MDTTWKLRYPLGQSWEEEQFICCTHSELLLFAHAAHVCRVGGLHLAKARIGGFIAMSA